MLGVVVTALLALPLAARPAPRYRTFAIVTG
jgi:hypothetical protein